MIVEDQGKIIELLSRPDAYGQGGGPIGRQETHISEIFLVGDRAYKLKRAVKFPYLDFSTAEKRRQACEAEVAINRRTAPGLYLGVIPVTREADGSLALDGGGAPVDWLVEMRRFDEDTLFDRLARAGKLDRDVMERLAEAIVRFHRDAEPCPNSGGRAGLAMIAENNLACFAEAPEGAFDADAVARLSQLTATAIADLGGILDRRRDMGRVRHCHGDLHLRNICLLDGEPTLFDAIEFNMEFAEIDVLYDLAFLLMDLDYDGLRGLANVALNRYLDLTQDITGLTCLPLFLSVRAAIRSHVAGAAAATTTEKSQIQPKIEEARKYLSMASGYLSPEPPVLVAVGGLSGSGKSRMARELAPHLGTAPGARVVRSDVTRKRLAGVHAFEKLGPGGYGAEMTKRTFEAVYAEARAVLETGYAVVADAVFAQPHQRAAIEQAAHDAGVPFHGLWLEAPLDVMVERVTARRSNASDADADIVRMQTGYNLGDIGWTRIDSSGGRAETVDQGLRAIGA